MDGRRAGARSPLVQRARAGHDLRRVNLAQNVGGGLIGVIAAYSAEWFGWRSAFMCRHSRDYCAIYLMLRLRDTPQSEGLRPSRVFARLSRRPKEHRRAREELGTRELLVDYILKNRYLWLIAGANFFVYIARYAMLDWGPTFLKEVKHASLGQGASARRRWNFAMASTVLADGSPTRLADAAA